MRDWCWEAERFWLEFLHQCALCVVVWLIRARGYRKKSEFPLTLQSNIPLNESEGRLYCKDPMNIS